jgi:hypothetical protein
LRLSYRQARRSWVEGKEVNRRLKLALVIVVGTALAVVVLLKIEIFLIDWGNW